MAGRGRFREIDGNLLLDYVKVFPVDNFALEVLANFPQSCGDCPISSS
jgi:hypothetical protein